MRPTNLLLYALIGVIAAAGMAAALQEREILALRRAVAETSREQHEYFKALGLAVGSLRNEQSKQWPLIEANLRDLDAANSALRNNITAVASALNVKHSPADIDIGALDSYHELDQGGKSVRDAAGRQRIACEADRRTAIIVTLGK